MNQHSDAVVMPVPRYHGSVLVVPAHGDGLGNWSGAPSAVYESGVYWLAYRVRRPLEEGRGVSVVLARSGDGVSFETVGAVSNEMFGSASLERPAIVPRPGGGWRLYVSCAAPGSKDWWIDALDSDTVESLPDARALTVLRGDGVTAVKDPVVHVVDGRWRMWVCCHPLSDAGAEDRMTTRVANSDDGLTWSLGPTVLSPRAGTWDARGTRVTSVVGRAEPLALYDGRPNAEENWYERTGTATADADGVFRATGTRPVAQSPFGRHALRYASAVDLGDSRWRVYFEAARRDGAHDLRTILLPHP
jgi:hypothetical protein